MRHLAVKKITDMFEGLTPQQRKALVQQDKEKQRNTLTSILTAKDTRTLNEKEGF